MRPAVCICCLLQATDFPENKRGFQPTEAALFVQRPLGAGADEEDADSMQDAEYPRLDCGLLYISFFHTLDRVANLVWSGGFMQRGY